MTEKKRRSKLETRFDDLLQEYQIEYEYEVTKIPYKIPESQHTYLVDFTVMPNVLCEVKGYLSDHTERKKYLLLKEQHPELDLKFIFESGKKLCGGTKYSHAEWATKHGFDWAEIKDREKILSWFGKHK